ncbi:uncharacterized protein LOC116672062 [Etheostoma spectabile]|nr:ubiquitin thioesterase otulin [Etheostoma spectabile]XP_032359532.1 ubiquitin thioesterase otulin [Etheostoma spectabile]XP_032359534.1 ubiquitin thioesterase otulin [Etheostoma spectabile]
MGNCCCRPESPCGSTEERSGLLEDDPKATGPTGETLVVGNGGPKKDDIRKVPDEANKKVEEAVQVKQSPEVAEMKRNNIEENGPCQKAVLQTATPSSSKKSKLKENSTRAEDNSVKDRLAFSGQAELLQCHCYSPQKEHTTAVSEASKEENPALQDQIPDSSSLTAEAVCPENHTETNPTREHNTLVTTHDEEVGSKVTIENNVFEPSGESSQNNEVLSVPKTPLAAAPCQVSSISGVSQESGKASPSCAVTEDSEKVNYSMCEEAGPDVVHIHDVCESPPESEPTGLDHCVEERDSADCDWEPEPTAAGSRSSKLDQDAQPDLGCTATSSKEVTSLENIKQDIGEEMMPKGQEKDQDVPKAKENDEIKKEAEKNPTEAETQAGKDSEIQEVTGKEEQLAGSTSTEGKADGIPVTEKDDSAEDGLGNSEEDLYRGAEELSSSPETAFLKVEDRCSLAPAVDILFYSEREWKGNTAKSVLIRKGYKEMSQRFGSVRRVRGDNYCALRATLFQVLSHSTQLPAWLQEDMLLKQLEAQEGLISQWTFRGECLQGDRTEDAAVQLKGYIELLRNTWQAAVDCSSAVERQQLCERVFQGGEEELGLLEALKLLMLGRAVELHSRMQGGGDIPLFCWLLFARDSSDCPRSFLSNHLSHVGLSAGLEQVEMFLLGYALQCTIQVYRLYKADTEEFITYFPDDHKDDWPSVCLVTEDDRHYNVPVVEAVEELHKRPNSS